ncbi:MAG: hypothetical protein CMK09_15015 [Ponticaulis sp.]|nr:hypothetical protein [Ponticaulis sp.]|tara:strand:- start:45692 stop:46486 length:795 start_codon:yes stop_codon:yes gene_type:complete
MTENAAGDLRVWTEETRDGTDLVQSVKTENGQWSEPEVLDWPKIVSNVNPAFSAYDDRLYFASDRPLPDAPERDDMNIWSVAWEGDSWGEASPIPGDVNTTADETDIAMAADGTAYFVSKHPRGLGGQDIARANLNAETSDWEYEALPDTISSRFVESHVSITPDGKTLIFYSRVRPIIGGVDLKIAELQDDGSWLGPFTLGKNINSTANEFGSGLSLNGDWFFFSRNGHLLEMPMADFRLEIDLAREAFANNQERRFLGLSDK